MRRSQRLMIKKDFSHETTYLVNNTPGCNESNTDIKIQKGNADNGNATNETNYIRLPTPVGEVYNKKFNDILSNKFKSTAEGITELIHINNKGTQKNNLIYKQRNQKQGRSAATGVAPPTTGKRKKGRTARQKIANQRNRLVAAMENDEIKAPTISIDNYLNPLRNPLIQTEVAPKPMENKSLYSYNTVIPTMSIQSNKYSLLPPMYPTHFKDQNFDGKLNNPTSQWIPYNANVLTDNHFPTPELTQSLDFDSSTSTLSIPESLRDVFGCDDIRDILKLDKVIFRMQVLHLQTLAFVLNIQYDYLINLVEKIMKLDTETLKKVVSAFQPEALTKCPAANTEEKCPILN